MAAAATFASGLFKSPDLVYQEAYEGRQFDAVYFAMMIFACLVALMGLLLNSPAVIIGAMLISPLMGPILACGLALTTAEWSLGKKALRNLGLSVAEVVLIAVIATALSPLREATPEILVRTNPNLMDLLIAFFSGLAGTVALAARKPGFTILPGVAIATAVMPPLATVGYGVGTRQWTIASGAFMLFFTNFTAIVLSASLVFLLIGFRPQGERLGVEHRLLIRWRIAIAAAVLATISVPLMRTLIRAAQQANIRGEVQDTLRRSTEGRGDRQVDSVSVQLLKGAVAVGTSIQTAQYMEPEDIEELRVAMEKRIGMPVSLRVQQLQLAQKSASREQVIRDFLAAGLVRPATADKPVSPAVEIGNLQQHLETSLHSLAGAAGITIQVTSVGKEADGTVTLNASAQAPRLTSGDMWSVTAAGLANEISAPVRINVTVAGTGAALEVAYHGAGGQPSPAELRRIRQFSAALPKDVKLAMLSSPDVDQALATRRIAHLRRLLVQQTAEAKLEPPSSVNVILLVPVQMLSGESLHVSNSPPQPVGATPR